MPPNTTPIDWQTIEDMGHALTTMELGGNVMTEQMVIEMGREFLGFCVMCGRELKANGIHVCH